jgi:hypothetical protein
MTEPALSAWAQLRTELTQSFPQLYELEPGGPLALDLGSSGWLLEIKPDGTAMDDVMALMSEGTPEDLGTDEVAKQAKYFLQPAVSKFRPLLLQSGFAEETEMNDEFVAVTFARTVNLQDPSKVQDLMRWCCRQIGEMS